MGTELNKVLSWEIDNFTERNDKMMKSDPFSSGGCNWCLYVFPKGYDHQESDHLSMYLGDVDNKELRRGWKRIVNFCLVLLDQSGKELFRRESNHKLFYAGALVCGFTRVLPFTKLQEKGFLEKNKLTIEVYMKVFEVVNGGKSTENDVIIDYNGFHIICSQIGPVGDIFRQHPDFAVDVKPKNHGVKTAYINLLLSLVETLKKSSQSLSTTELSNAQSELTELTEAGFKLDWLHSRLQEVSLERKKALSDGTWVQQLEERIKNLELTLSDLNVELDKERIKSAAAAKVSSFDFIDFFIERFFLSCFSVSKN